MELTELSQKVGASVSGSPSKKSKLTIEDTDKVRHIEGFPIAKDEDIIALSDPPYYTACPNPFLHEFIEKHGKPYDPATDDYHREPFAADVSEGRSGLFYDAHSYHTKVPHKAIMRYILHYTDPGDIVYDGFCGTGMTGVAAQMCSLRSPTTSSYGLFSQVWLELKSGDLFIEGSEKFGDWRNQLISWEEYDASLDAYCQQVGCPKNPSEFIQGLKTWLTETIKEVDATFPENESVSIKDNEPVIRGKTKSSVVFCRHAKREKPHSIGFSGKLM